MSAHGSSWTGPLCRRGFLLLWGADMFAASDAHESFVVGPNGWMPNNPKLPVVIYHGLAAGVSDVASAMESMFDRNGWPSQWRNGVYPFHHYHSTAHEVLGFAKGTARLMLGGENGREVRVSAGDVVVLPAGTGHCRIGASSDFLVIGAYPTGQSWDLRRSGADAATLARIAKVPLPSEDPVSGKSGPLVKLWR
jgi:uncharacterized protein YjlB